MSNLLIDTLFLFMLPCYICVKEGQTMITKSMQQYLDELNKVVRGRRIQHIRFMTDAEMRQWYWFDKGLIIQLDNRVSLLILQDEEGNGPGFIELL